MGWLLVLMTSPRWWSHFIWDALAFFSKWKAEKRWKLCDLSVDTTTVRLFSKKSFKCIESLKKKTPQTFDPSLFPFHLTSSPSMTALPWRRSTCCWGSTVSNSRRVGRQPVACQRKGGRRRRAPRPSERWVPLCVCQKTGIHMRVPSLRWNLLRREKMFVEWRWSSGVLSAGRGVWLPTRLIVMYFFFFISEAKATTWRWANCYTWWIYG